MTAHVGYDTFIKINGNVQIVGANNREKFKIRKSLSIYNNLRISHIVPIVVFEAHTQVVPVQVPWFAQVIAWELVSGLQPNTIKNILINDRLRQPQNLHWPHRVPVKYAGQVHVAAPLTTVHVPPLRHTFGKQGLVVI